MKHSRAKPKALVPLAELLRAVHAIAPPALAEEWDNVGLQVGNPGAAVRRVMTCLELTLPTLREAVERKVDAVVAHHPLIFKPLSSVNLAQPVGALIAGLIRNEIALIAAHTNLDAAAWGTNTVLAEACGLDIEGPLVPREWAGAEGERQTVGLGLIARLEEARPIAEFAQSIKRMLGLGQVRVSGSALKKVRKVAICSGSGGSLIGRVAGRAEALLTGEINYHHAVEAHARGLAVIEVGHFASEVIVAGPLAARLGTMLPGIEIFAARKDLQPFRTE